MPTRSFEKRGSGIRGREREEACDVNVVNVVNVVSVDGDNDVQVGVFVATLAIQPTSFFSKLYF